MLTRVRGMLESVGDTSVVVVPDGLGIAFEVFVPVYVIEHLQTQIGQSIDLHTIATLDSSNQGASFNPRLIGFTSPTDRGFFELMTTVKGLGARKCLKAMAQPPGAIAAAIASRDAKALQKLPEIGKRLAETIIAALDGKVAPFASFEHDADGSVRSTGLSASNVALETLSPAGRDAADALVALGEPQESARERVALACEALGEDASSAALIDAVFAQAKR
jgi:Holliday junction DNA helicase RuvA